MKKRSDLNLEPKHRNIKNIFRSLQYKNFRLFFSGQSISLVGTWIQLITTPWLVYHLTGSAFELGLVGFASQIPVFLIAPFAGVLTDRWNKFNILLFTQIAAMVQAAILAILYFTDVIQVWHILLLSLILGVVNAFDSPARQSFIVDMIEKKEDLGNAIALNSLMVNGARLLGPSIAGMLIAFFSEGVCFSINAFSYVFVITSLLLMKIPKKQVKKVNKKVLSELKDGVKYAIDFPPIKYIILLLVLLSVMGFPYRVLMPIFAKEILHGGSHTFGFLMGASGLGAFLSALFLASKKNALGLEVLIPIATAIFGLGIVLFSFSHFMVLSLFLMVFIGSGMMLQMASSNTILQTIVIDDKRGRVMSFYTMALMGTAPFGSLFSGWIATYIGAPNTLLIGGIACIIGAAVFASKLPKLKAAIRPVYVNLGFISDEPIEVEKAINLKITSKKH